MKFKLEINCDNAAFEGDNRYAEVERILCEIEIGRGPGTIYDVNGNRVGSFVWVDE